MRALFIGIATMLRTCGAALMGFSGMGFLLGWATVNFLWLGICIYLTALLIYGIALALDSTE